MDITQKQANADAVAEVVTMAAAVNSQVLEASQEQEKTVQNMNQLMIVAEAMPGTPPPVSDKGGSGSGR